MNTEIVQQQAKSTEIFQICLKDAGLERNAWDRFIVGCKKKSNNKDCSCCDKNCDYPSSEDVVELIEKINSFITKKGGAYGQFLSYGFPQVCLQNIEELLIYKDVLTKLNEGLVLEEKGYVKTNCVCPNKFPSIRSSVISIIGNQGVDYYNQEKDESGMDEWLLKNPNCVSFDRWKRVYYKLVPDYKITVTPVAEKECGFIYKVIVDQEKTLDVVVKALKEADKNCGVKYSASLQEDRCKESFKSIVQESKCDISYKAFVSAMNCGFSVKSIQNLYACGVKIKASSKKDNCIISFNSNEEVICNKDNLKILLNKIQCVI
ncbi:MAG: hypothetical protein WAT79_08935 [Saprospiraceae bacterium]